MANPDAAASGPHARTTADVDEDLRALRLQMACPCRWAEYGEVRAGVLHAEMDRLLDERETLTG